MDHLCPWCVEVEVPTPGELCATCAANPDAVEFKAAHDATCSCRNLEAPPPVPIEYVLPPGVDA